MSKGMLSPEEIAALLAGTEYPYQRAREKPVPEGRGKNLLNSEFKREYLRLKEEAVKRITGRAGEIVSAEAAAFAQRLLDLYKQTHSGGTGE